MAKMPVEFGEWRPDIALLDNKFASEVENVTAGLNSYEPFPGLQRFSPTALSGNVCGLTVARTSAGNWKIYAGTRTKLYTWTLGGWSDISTGSYNVTEGNLWSFAQSGHYLVAVNPNDDPQYVDIDGGGNFIDLPNATSLDANNVKQIGDFLVLAGLTSNSRKIQWSAINDITGWTIGTNLSDEQEFPDGGPVMGIAGSEIGYVVQERAIRTMQFLPGDTTYIFNFSRILDDRGCISKYGFTSVGNNLYFVAEDGFYAIGGQQVTPIGHDKVNKWWLANSDADRRNVVQAFTWITAPHVAWAYHASSASQTYDRLIIFDWSNQKWSKVTEQAQVWSALASQGLDLDTTGSETDDNLLDSAAMPLDSFAYIGGRPQVGAIDESGYLSTLTGPNLRAVMETAEYHLAPGGRSFISEVYPLVDGADDMTVAVGIRERLQDPVVWQPEVPIEITGSATVLSSSRLHRCRVMVPQGEVWTHAQGAMVEVQQDGSVA